VDERTRIDQQAREFFEGLWQRGDHWELESSAFEQTKYTRMLALLDGGHYSRVLELGCGAGTLTRHLASRADYVLALDIASGAINRAQALWTGPATVDFRQANIMEYNPHAGGPWDLVVLSDIMYYLGWLYSFFDINWFASQLFTATRVGGYCLYANAMGSFGDMLLLPCITRSYRDVLRNVGYSPVTEDIFRAQKNRVTIEVLIDLFTKGV
jgi:SAM-dependent methyltransferase